MTDRLHKYPRTHHLEGSRLQPGDEDVESRPFADLVGRHLVVEEKLDGANAGVSFTKSGDLRLQSRGHFLAGGPREKHFDLLKQWAHSAAYALWNVLGDRYVLYGEWLYAKHTIFYDRLPHFFLEFDVLDTADGSFLSTDRRRELLSAAPVVSVPVVWRGPAPHARELVGLIGPSRYQSEDWRGRLRALCRERDLDPEQIARETDPSNLAEGLYVKVEEDGVIRERLKYVRATFLTSVLVSGSHWLTRPIVPNQLAPGVDLFGTPG